MDFLSPLWVCGHFFFWPFSQKRDFCQDFLSQGLSCPWTFDLWFISFCTEEATCGRDGCTVCAFIMYKLYSINICKDTFSSNIIHHFKDVFVFYCLGILRIFQMGQKIKRLAHLLRDYSREHLPRWREHSLTRTRLRTATLPINPLIQLTHEGYMACDCYY